MQFHVIATSKRLTIRGLLLLAIVASELVVMTTRYEVPPSLANDANWSARLLYSSKDIWAVILWIAGACLLIFSPRLKGIVSDFRKQASGHRWRIWLAFHVLVFAAFAVVTALIFATPSNSAHLSAAWFSGWIALLSATLLLWLFALAPGHFWRRLIRQERTALLMGGLLGMAAWMLMGMLTRQEAPLGQKEFWNFLAMPTLQLVRSMLGWVYSDIVYQPEKDLVGTASFQVEISEACSGIEGISLITLFLAIYLWLFRGDLRFPQCFWLFPFGIIVIWLANAVRIAMLIAIGASFSPAVALQGFHTQAGWITFTLIAFAAIALSNRMRFFAAAEPDFPVERTCKPLAVALLVPLLALMAASMVTSAFSSGFDKLYPLRVAIVFAALYYFRKDYNGLDWRWSWQAPAIGTAVFLVWMLLEPDVDSSKTALSQGLSALSSGPAAVWLVFRVFGSVIAVPLAEELAFRGYLIRKLAARDFENVPPGQFSWASFILTSLLFGLMHERWIAGTLAGMGYALALYRRGRLGDAVVAHMTTNALIAVLVLTQAEWALWS